MFSNSVLENVKLVFLNGISAFNYRISLKSKIDTNRKNAGINIRTTLCCANKENIHEMCVRFGTISTVSISF